MLAIATIPHQHAELVHFELPGRAFADAHQASRAQRDNDPAASVIESLKLCIRAQRFDGHRLLA